MSLIVRRPLVIVGGLIKELPTADDIYFQNKGIGLRANRGSSPGGDTNLTTSTVFTLISWTGTVFDSSSPSWLNTSNGRITPSEGTVLITGILGIASGLVGGELIQAAVFKNGSATSLMQPGTVPGQATLFGIYIANAPFAIVDTCNGTDYYEIKGAFYHGTAGNRVVSGDPRTSYVSVVHLGFPGVIVVNDGPATATLTGTATEGQVLTTTFNNNDPDGAAISGPTYQWLRRNGANVTSAISGATASTYTLVFADVDNAIRCRVNYTDGEGFAEQILSNETAAVAPLVSASSTTFNSGSGNFTVPSYNTLTVETWGGGAGGDYGVVNTSLTRGGAGTASTVSTLGMTANGGGATTGGNGAGGIGNAVTAATAATATGGNNTNTSGTTGGNDTGNQASTAQTSGVGGTAPGSGGAGGASVTTSAINQHLAGNPGTAPGGGGSGGADSTGVGQGRGYHGGASGAYSKSIYTRNVTSGFPVIGASLAYAVGSAGAASNGNAGAAGRVKFTWA